MSKNAPFVFGIVFVLAIGLLWINTEGAARLLAAAGQLAQESK